MNEETIPIYVTAAFSASFLVSQADGKISTEEIDAFEQALQVRHDLELDQGDASESFKYAMKLDKNEHLSRVAGAAGLSEDLRREILDIALAVAAADGEVSLSEVLCLPDIAGALGIELEEVEDAKRTRSMNNGIRADQHSEASMAIEWVSLKGDVDRNGTAKVIGFVQNNTDRNLDLEIEVTFYNGDEFLGHETTWVGVRSGSKRPFEVMEFNCPMTRFEIEAHER